MRIITRKIKKMLHAKSVPDFVFATYFDRMAVKKREHLNHVLASSDNLMDQLSDQEKVHWEGRINDVLSGPDNKDIPRCPYAGELVKGSLVMHNDIRIDPLSYYNYPLLKMLIDNKGVHEPQEEKIFQEVLKSLNKEKQMTMLELGSYWSFYSMWFMKAFPTARCIMAEPNRNNLFYGKRNLALNNQTGEFIYTGIGKALDRKNNITTVDRICEQKNIEFVDILHSDIQGYELDMLKGSEKLLSKGNVGYVFISTHSNDLHRDCFELLRDKYQLDLVATADLDETFSWDGILVMKAPSYQGISKVDIAKKNNRS